MSGARVVAVVMRRRPSGARLRRRCTGERWLFHLHLHRPSPVHPAQFKATESYKLDGHTAHSSASHFPLITTVNHCVLDAYISPSRSRTSTTCRKPQMKLARCLHCAVYMRGKDILIAPFVLPAFICYRRVDLGCPRVAEEQLGLVPQVVCILAVLQVLLSTHLCFLCKTSPELHLCRAISRL